ncbi:diguanylate cyclase [Lutibacter sp. B2]|nr:diguanylate cyclase [Lutibacter sp. B2]
MKKLKYYFNSLGFKVNNALLLVGIIPIIVFLVFNNIMVSKYFSAIEEKNILDKTQQAYKIFQSKNLEIETLAKDYAIWDDTYEKIEQKDKVWFKENFLDYIPSDLDMDLIVVADKNKEIVAEYGLQDKDGSELLEDKTIHKLVNKDYYDSNDTFKGIKEVNGNLYMIGFAPIIKSNYEGPSRGIVIFGKKITFEFVKEIEQQFGYTVFFLHHDQLISNEVIFLYDNRVITEEQINEEVKNNSHIIKQIKKKRVVELGKTKIIGSMSIQDISNKELGYMGVIESRDLFFSTLSFIRRNTFEILLISCSLILFISLKLKNNIINPIQNLEKEITKISQNQSLVHVNVKGPNEIVRLGSAFNQMTDSIYKHKKENENLKIISNTDDLTSLYNHRYFYECLNNKISQGIKPLTLLICDIDKFKALNDTYGYTTGDMILKEVANVIKESVKESEFVFRYGGEEFAVLLESGTLEQIFQTAEKIRVNIMKSKKLGEYVSYLTVTVSNGLATYPFDASDAENLVEKANKALYFSKQNGRNKSYIYNKEMDELLEKNYDEFEKQELLMNSAFALTAAIDAKDVYTGKHSEMVAKYSLLLAEKLKLLKQDKYIIRIGALLHDCGKIGIPDDIIHKPGKLTDEEFTIVKNHTLLGNSIVKYIVKNAGIVSCVRNHHERWDGRGYPDGLSGEDIPLYARIVCIADTYHAMTSDRPYRNALSQEQAFEELRKNKGTQFDPGLVDLFIQTICEDEYENKIDECSV